MNQNHLNILTSLCNLPTAPYCEQHVIAALLHWAQTHPAQITAEQDPIGNVYLHYLGPDSQRTPTPLVIEAHMDHPGFVAGTPIQPSDPSNIHAEFWGGVKPSCFPGASVRFWINEPLALGNVRPVPARGHWIPGRVTQATPSTTGLKNTINALVEDLAEPVPPGSIGMWDLPDAQVQNDLFAARVCDDVAGVAAVICLLEELIAQNIPGHVIGLLTRAEEVGFAGVLAVCTNATLPPASRIIGLETSQAAPPGTTGGGIQGDGAIVRVGDKTGLFSPGLTHFLSQAAAAIADEHPDFKWQRKLMAGGTCNSTAFVAWGYDTAAMCVGLGNYHNMTTPDTAGFGHGARTGDHIASETIHLADFTGMVQILLEAARSMAQQKYQPNFAAIRDRFTKLYETQQREKLLATAPPTPK